MAFHRIRLLSGDNALNQKKRCTQCTLEIQSVPPNPVCVFNLQTTIQERTQIKLFYAFYTTNCKMFPEVMRHQQNVCGSFQEKRNGNRSHISRGCLPMRWPVRWPFYRWHTVAVAQCWLVDGILRPATWHGPRIQSKEGDNERGRERGTVRVTQAISWPGVWRNIKERNIKK